MGGVGLMSFPPILFIPALLIRVDYKTMALSNSINPTFQAVSLTDGQVTQATNATTAVTLNAKAGQITTVAQNIAAAGEVSFDVVNNQATTKSAVIANVASGSIGGTTQAFVKGASAGSFTLTLANLHASVAETGTLVVNFAVIN